MFSWLSVLLAVVGGLHNYSGCKVPSHVSIGQSGQTRHCIHDGSHWGEGSNYFPGSGVTIQQRKKMLESQTLQEEIDKHAMFCTCLEAGIWSMQGSFKTPEAKIHVGVDWITDAQASFLTAPGREMDRLSYLIFSVQS